MSAAMPRLDIRNYSASAPALRTLFLNDFVRKYRLRPRSEWDAVLVLECFREEFLKHCRDLRRAAGHFDWGFEEEEVSSREGTEEREIPTQVVPSVPGQGM